MKKAALVITLISVILVMASCKEKKIEGPLAQYTEKDQNIITLRMDYELKLENWILKSDTNEIIMNLSIKNKAKKGHLNFLTLKFVQYDVDGNPLTESLLPINVDSIGNGETKTLLLKYPNAIEGIEGLSVELEPYPLKEQLKKYKEFSS
jgi:hypothetical protein